MSGADRWDARYRAIESPFGNAPNDWLVACLERWRRLRGVSPASALLLADGDGRNGAWLAAQGTAVTALDASPVATELAVRRDCAAGVKVTREVADLAHWQAPADLRHELAAVIYLQAERDVRRRAIELAAASLVPGGWLVVEGFAQRGCAERCCPEEKDGESVAALGPEGDDRRYSLDDLSEWSGPLLPRTSELRTLSLNEGPRHRGVAWVVRFLAQAP